MKMAEQALAALYAERFGAQPHITPLAQSGSSRRYFRLESEGVQPVIGTAGTDVAENEDFLTLRGAMAADGTKVPEVYAVSDDRMCYFQQDLGNTPLFSLLHTDEAPGLVERAVKALAHLQIGTRTVGTAALVRPPFSERLVLWDLNYFKYCFLKPMEINFDENLLEDDMQRMAARMTGCDIRLWGFMYRDCQSRNIMLHSGELYWIDFQGGRPGPMAYDVASLLWQARAGFADDFRKRMIQVYAEEVAGIRDIEPQAVTDAVFDIVPLRVLQTLGAYGFRGLVQRKEHFLKSIEAGITSLHNLAIEGMIDLYPELLKIAEKLWKRIN